MDVSMMARVLWLRRGLRGHERWTQAQLEARQRPELAALRAFAAERSPFYQDLHRGLDRAPLVELPVITKATVMDNFDQISTDRPSAWPICRPTWIRCMAISRSGASTGWRPPRAAPGARASSRPASANGR